MNSTASSSSHAVFTRALALVASAGLCAMSTGCYNTYFIDKNELQKLQSTVEQREVVQVYADCPAGSEPEVEVSRYRSLDGTMWAQNGAASSPAEGEGVSSDASDVEAAPSAPAA